MYSGQLIIDADYTAFGWEIALRWDCESMEVAWCGVSDAVLPEVVGQSAAISLVTDRDGNRSLDESAQRA